MDGLALLDQAAAAGLTARIDGARLVIRGPRSAQPVARALLDHKPEVIAALNARIARRWGDATEAIAWFMSSEPPSEPFVLWPGDPPQRAFVTVLHPALYWRALGADVVAGPGRARDMYGAVRRDVVRLYALFGNPCATEPAA